MRQISLRQEAGRLGGIGVCGRELCCSTWLSDFKNVATSAARYQNLSLNPSKLSGQCGRLKCCLNYELETYMDALKFIPEVETPLLTEKGEARLQKTDIFRKIMWFAYKEENNWYALNVDRVNEILTLNRAGKKPASLELDQVEVKIPIATLNSDLENLDKEFQNSDTSKKYNLLLDLRHSLDYPFARLFVNYELKKDSLTLSKELISVYLFDQKTGKPFGKSGIGDIYDHQFSILKAYTFKRA